MSVSAFFRDTRVTGGQKRLSARDSADALSQFFQRYSYEACSADQLLALADLALRASDEPVVREALTRALATQERVHLAYYKLGRLELGLGRIQAACDCFGWGTEVDPGFPYNWMGRARALLALGRVAEAAPFAERFVSFAVRPHAAEEVAVLAEIADYLFEREARLRAGPIYAALGAWAPPSQKTVVRLAESLIAAGDQAGALAVLRPAQAQDSLDLWGRRALAQCESHAGNHAAAIALAGSVVGERPEDAGFVTSWLDVLVRAQRAGPAVPHRWHEALADLGARLPQAGRAELQARAALADADVDAALAICAGMDVLAETRLFYMCLEVAYAALSAGRTADAADLAGRLAQARPGVTAPLVLQVDIYLREQLWDDAGRTLRLVSAKDSSLPHILLKWFEYHCFVGDKEAAANALARLEAGGAVPREFTPPILRYMAEQHRWAEAMNRGAAWIGGDFRFEQVGYVLFRAARHTGRQADLVAAIERVDGWQALPELVRLHTSLAWDGAGSLAEMEHVAGDPRRHTSPAAARRMDVQRELMARACAPPGRRALFLCTDAGYLCSTLVTLHSALLHSAPGREDCFVVVDDSLAEKAGELVQPLRDQGFSVSIVPASEIVADTSALSPAYGMFTSGHMLAQAAYYRIFFARHLQRLGLYSRAVYIDGDILVRRPLDGLFTAAMSGQPLAARVETPRPEVSRAIRLHGFEADLYFNSGVLLFDLANDRLEAALEAATAAISDTRVKLLLHDQCALNLGFRNSFLRLGTAWNTPVGEATRLADLPPDAAVLHYLDRPKPWSAAYDGECGTLWFDAWARTAEVIGAAEAVALFALNRE